MLADKSLQEITFADKFLGSYEWIIIILIVEADYYCCKLFAWSLTCYWHHMWMVFCMHPIEMMAVDIDHYSSTQLIQLCWKSKL
jgi:hypothetical protein